MGGIGSEQYVRFLEAKKHYFSLQTKVVSPNESCGKQANDSLALPQICLQIRFVLSSKGHPKFPLQPAKPEKMKKFDTP